MPRVKHFWVILTLCTLLLFLYLRASRPEHLNPQSPRQSVHSDTIHISADSKKQQAVITAFKHAWSAYRRDAWGFDEYHPIANKGTNLCPAGGIGYTIIDALDSLLIMGLHDEYQEAKQWITDELTFDREGKVNTFELTIRVLGGLLSAYHLSHDEILLEKAIDLAERTMPVFETKTGLPLSFIDLATRQGIHDLDNRGMVSTAEAATIQLEFKYLSYLTDDYSYWKAAEKTMETIRKAGGDSGLVPIFLDHQNGGFIATPIRFGSRGDSYYEYLLKQYLQTSKEESVYREMWDQAMDSMHHDLVHRTPANNLLYIAELNPRPNRATGQFDWTLSAKQDHLVCFLGGALLLSVTEGEGPIPPDWDSLSWTQKRDWHTGMELIETCLKTHNTATGLSPEIAHFKKPGDDDAQTVDWYIKGLDPNHPQHTSFDARYILRPETVESLFIAFRLTGDPKYREQGWKIFQSIEKYCKVPGGGYASILNVNSTEPEMEDKMETFFLSETLKYLYLLFSAPDILPLDEYVFNTEAHPLPIFEPSIRVSHH